MRNRLLPPTSACGTSATFVRLAALSKVHSEADSRASPIAAKQVCEKWTLTDFPLELPACRAEKGEVISPTGERLKYGALVDAAAKLSVPENVALKKPKDFTLI